MKQCSIYLILSRGQIAPHIKMETNLMLAFTLNGLFNSYFLLHRLSFSIKYLYLSFVSFSFQPQPNISR